MSTALLFTALSVGVIHTLLGPDHYLPFIMLGKARNWSIGKTARITFLCGAGHVLGAALLGFAAIYFGLNVLKLRAFESARGSLAAWALIAFGFIYFVWGLRRTFAKEVKEKLNAGSGLTPWVLFIIFALGPCEPLIPLIMYAPAHGGGAAEAAVITLVFGAATVATMLVTVMGSRYGLKMVKFNGFRKWGHAAAGFAVLACGLSMRFLGL